MAFRSSALRTAARAPVLALLAAALLWTGCQPDPPVRDTVDTSVPLVNQDSTAVTFPNAYRGQIVVIGYIYTQCPDVCPMITANMQKVRRQLASTEGVQFVSITFDPQRDTPRRLREYRRAFGLEDAGWEFLTGSPAAVDTLMAHMGIRTSISLPDSTDADSTGAAPGPNDTYFINHSDQITLLDGRGRVRGEYSGSRTPPKYIVEDIQKVRS